MKTALVVGATGLVGSHLLANLLSDNHYQHVKAATRKPLNASHAKLTNVITDFDNLHAVAADLAADDVFCCLGTTIKQAGSKKAFEQVDYYYPLELAKITKQLGASQYLLVSALGANENSSIFYNRVKGQTETAIRNIGFDAFHIFRPSLLLGSRKDRLSGEEAAKVFYGIFGRFLPTRLKAIDATKVANAMCQFALQSKKGVFVHESDVLQSF